MRSENKPRDDRPNGRGRSRPSEIAFDFGRLPQPGMAYDRTMPTVIRTVRVLVHGQRAFGEPAGSIRWRVIRSAELALRQADPPRDALRFPFTGDDEDPADLVSSFTQMLQWSFERDGVRGGRGSVRRQALSLVRRVVATAMTEPIQRGGTVDLTP
jgi:hypothetical protein